MFAPITKEVFGQTSKGEEIYKFTFCNDKRVTISVLNYGCVIYEIKTPDKDGKVVDINLGYDHLTDYEKNSNYIGALCGRVANRIGNAKFTLDRTTYELSKNDPLGGHFVHGGHVGFSRSVWSWSIKDDQLTLSLTDPDGSEGLPGEVVTHVTMSLDNDNVFTMDYKATTTKPTPIDMGSHFMVNLAGHGHGHISDHSLQLNSHWYLTMGKDFLPTGKFTQVCGTYADFRVKRKLVGQTLELIGDEEGLHHAMIVEGAPHDPPSKYKGKKKLVGRVEHQGTGRYMEVQSTNLTVFVYSNGFMEELLGDLPCKDGVVYKKFGAIELMPMGYPNAVNQPKFPSSIVRPGETYHETAWYKFGVVGDDKK